METSPTNNPEQQQQSLLSPAPVISDFCQHKCLKKEGKADVPAEYHCYDCKSSYCADCSQKAHKYSTQQHNTIKWTQQIKETIYDLLHRTYTAAEVKSDDDNLFVLVDAHDGSTPKMVVGPKFNDSGFESDSPMQIASFVGPTGVGKSRIMRHLCSSTSAKPFPGNRGSHEPCTSDLHAYVGHIPEEHLLPEMRFLLVDSEGFGGTTPTNSWFSQQVPNHQELHEKRIIFVQKCYPRLLYLFSDVLCFVFPGTQYKEKATVVDLLLSYAEMSAAGSTNHQILPYVIIVYNQVVESQIEWDVKEMTKQWRALLPPEQSLRFDRFYKEILVVCIPHYGSEGAHISHYLKQLEELKSVMHRFLRQAKEARVRARQLFDRSTSFNFISDALRAFNRNQNAVFDLFALKLQCRPLSKGFADRLWEFFRILKHHLSKQHSQQRAWNLAATITAQRALIAIQIDMHRNGAADIAGAAQQVFASKLWLSFIRLGSSAVPMARYNDKLQELQDKINNELPCSATTAFDELTSPVQCETVWCAHSAGHQSKTWVKYVTRTGYFDKVFRRTEPRYVACRWEGDFSIGELQKLNINATITELWSNRTPEKSAIEANKEYLALQSSRHIFPNLPPTTVVCTCCLLNSPSALLDCGHAICSDCCAEDWEREATNCSVCGITYTARSEPLSAKAGVRILSLDGGGIRGVCEAAALIAIQAAVGGIPIPALFDIIAGTSTGGLIALALGLGNSPEDIYSLYQSLGKNAFEPALVSYVPFLGTPLASYLRGGKYKREPLHKLLTEKLGTSKMSQLAKCTARILVPSCTLDDGSIRTYCFRSYVAPTGAEEPPAVASELANATVTDAAEATSAAPTYFPAFEGKNCRFLDGGLTSNNPSVLATTEANRLWPNKPLDVVVSLGTGLWINSSVQGNSEVLRLVNHTFNMATDTNRLWDEMRARVQPNPDAVCFRLNPTLTSDIKLDDYEMIEKAFSIARDYLSHDGRQLVLNVAKKLLAVLFYFEIDSADAPLSNSLLLGVGSRTLSGTIKCRSPAHLPQFVLDALTSDPNHVFVFVEAKQPNHSSVFNPKVNMKVHCHSKTNKLSHVSVKLSKLPIKATEVNIIFKQNPIGGAAEVDYPISGMPFVTSTD